MKLTILDADLDKDRQTVIDTLNRNRDYEVDRRRFDWLYINNPAGQARVWLLRDEDAGTVIGTSAALPRRMWLQGEQVTIYVMSDFAIDVKYRSIGPALKLNRHSLGPVFKGEVPFAYDFPTETMSVAHKWMKVEPIGKQLRFVQPLRLDGQIEKVLGQNIMSQAASLLGNLAVKAYASVLTLSRGYDVDSDDVDPNTFDAAFTDLDRQVGPNYKVCGVRDQAYLNWHYGQNPLRSYRVIRLSRQDQLVGYAVYTRDDARVNVHELYALNESDVQRNLLSALLTTAVAGNADGVEVSLLDTNKWIPLLKRRGYVLRPPEDKIYVFLPKQTDLEGLANRADNWYMTQGDNDT